MINTTVCPNLEVFFEDGVVLREIRIQKSFKIENEREVIKKVTREKWKRNESDIKNEKNRVEGQRYWTMRLVKWINVTMNNVFTECNKVQRTENEEFVKINA